MLTKGLSKVLQRPKLLSGQNRGFFGWLLPFFNQVDKDRIDQVGPDRACAEWLLKNGAAVKWHKSDKFLKFK